MAATRRRMTCAKNTKIITLPLLSRAPPSSAGRGRFTCPSLPEGTQPRTAEDGSLFTVAADGRPSSGIRAVTRIAQKAWATSSPAAGPGRWRRKSPWGVGERNTYDSASQRSDGIGSPSSLCLAPVRLINPTLEEHT